MQELQSRRLTSGVGGRGQQLASGKVCMHLANFFKEFVLWPRAVVASHHQLLDVRVLGGDIG